MNILEKTKELNNKPELPTAVTRDLGFWQILKLVLYLKIQSLTENYGVLFPKPRVAAKRQAVKKPFFFYNFLYQNAYIFTLCQANFEFILVGSRNNRG